MPALLLILLGAFTKSAQFPFHFWLPHAMAAPTPVSAYLHSATMVKAGLFLMARLWPVLSGTDLWFYLVAGAGLITMTLGAVIALFKDDLKGLLAFSTVSHLGLITMLLGMGTEIAAVVAVFHIINHATFKAALFMTAGIIDHEAHTRDIKRLGGLRLLMPVTFVIGTIAALSMAGLPPFNGFMSKEMMLEEAAHTSTLFMVVATVAATFSVAYSLRFVFHVFFGPKRDDYPAKPHDPGFGMWAAPALLATLVMADRPVSRKPWSARWWRPCRNGRHAGGCVALLLAGAVARGEHGADHVDHRGGLGAVLLLLHKALDRAWIAAPRPEAKAIFDACWVRSPAAPRADRYAA